MNQPYNTNEEFKAVLKNCRDLFAKKLHDYGAAWRILRPASVTDQLYIKVNRIRSIEMKGHSEVGEDIVGEFIAIVNYGLIGQIQLALGPSLGENDMTPEQALELMMKKNHDYDEAWRLMRVSSYTDLILMKVFRTKQIEDLDGATMVSEGVAANYMDMINYAVFGLIKLTIEGEN